jgi:hypothetical protein
MVSREKRLSVVEEQTQELLLAMKEQIKDVVPHPSFGPDVLTEKLKGLIFQLLDHKEGLTPIDHQLLDLVAEHAPKTLLSAYLLSHRQKSGTGY